MHAITKNHAGGARKQHKSVESAARRIARQQDVYLGYRLAEYDSDETREAIEDRAKAMRDEDAGIR